MQYKSHVNAKSAVLLALIKLSVEETETLPILLDRFTIVYGRFGEKSAELAVCQNCMNKGVNRGHFFGGVGGCDPVVHICQYGSAT